MQETKLMHFFKDTIIGMIFLGVIGSILAYYLIKVFKILGKRFAVLGKKILIKYQLKPFVIAGYLASKYIRENDNNRLNLLYIENLIKYQTSINRFIVFSFLMLIGFNGNAFLPVFAIRLFFSNTGVLVATSRARALCEGWLITLGLMLA